MRFDPTLAAIRFGTGLSPVLPAPVSVAAMISRLAGPDEAAVRWPVPTYEAMTPTRAMIADATRRRRQTRGTPDEAQAEAAFQDTRRAIGAGVLEGLTRIVARQIGTADGLRERLVLFWADHFTVRSRNFAGLHLITPFVESVIRPHVAGRFADMLRAVVLHPEMVIYLDQATSVGPGSPAAARRRRGLNENLAREVLELHTLGVGGPYGQNDVRELAELLSGLVWDPTRGLHFREDSAEPGSETVLGTTYSPRAEIGVISAALDDLAAHPATAAHLAHKLAVHFVSENPPPELVDAMTDSFRATGGDLLAVTAAMLAHPSAWTAPLGKAKPPFSFLTSALRALGVPAETIMAADAALLRRLFLRPLREMGQPWQEPLGPDGWSEASEAWISPQGLAIRIGWAMQMPRRIVDPLPDPRVFVATALGPLAGAATLFAAEAAESRADGVGVVLASADFNRR
jgi:uncharacterized protein (DUF1800 family)